MENDSNDIEIKSETGDNNNDGFICEVCSKCCESKTKTFFFYICLKCISMPSFPWNEPFLTINSLLLFVQLFSSPTQPDTSVGNVPYLSSVSTNNKKI